MIQVNDTIAVLLLHFYYYCYRAFEKWQLTSTTTDWLPHNIWPKVLFSNLHKSKLIALCLLVIALLGAKGLKDEILGYRPIVVYMATGLLLYLGGYICLYMRESITTIAVLYGIITTTGFVLFLTGGTLLSRIIKVRLRNDIFNKENETFPQEERLLKNEYSINLPAQYHLKIKIRKSWNNIINPFHGLLFLSSPGSGKSYFVIQHIIKQHIGKGFSMFVYDFKFDDHTRIAYNQIRQNWNKYPAAAGFYVINFDDLSHSNLCNPMDVSTMHDISDAAESSRTIILRLNQEWIKKQGDFFLWSHR